MKGIAEQLGITVEELEDIQDEVLVIVSNNHRKTDVAKEIASLEHPIEIKVIMGMAAGAMTS